MPRQRQDKDGTADSLAELNEELLAENEGLLKQNERLWVLAGAGFLAGIALGMTARAMYDKVRD